MKIVNVLTYNDLFQYLKNISHSNIVSEHDMKRKINDNLLTNFYINNLLNANDIVYGYVIVLVFPVTTNVFEPINNMFVDLKCSQKPGL